MFDEDVTAEDLARETIRSCEESDDEVEEEEDKFEKSFKTAAEFIASPAGFIM